MRGNMLPSDLGRYEFDIYKNGRKIELYNHDSCDGFSGVAIAFVRGRQDLVYIAPLREFDLTVIIGRPYYIAFWSLRSIIRYIIWILFFAFIIAVVLSIFISKKIASPIEALTGGLDKAGQGIYLQKIDYAGEDEIGAAFKAFNKLIKKLYRHSVIDSFWREKWRE